MHPLRPILWTKNIAFPVALKNIILFFKTYLILCWVLQKKKTLKILFPTPYRLALKQK